MNKENEDIDNIVDNFDFKPITEGLGFHHSLKDEKEVRVDLNKQSRALKRELETRVDQLQKPTTVDIKPNMGDLAPFYTNTTESQTTTLPVTEVVEEEVIEAPNYILASTTKKFMAWSVDFFLLISVLCLTMASIIFFADLPMEIISTFMLFDEIPTSALTIFTLFYLFYFSFLDKTAHSTFGKRLFGLTVTGFDEKQISFSKSFYRAFMTVISIPFLGLPLFLNLQDKLTDTIVIEKHD